MTYATGSISSVTVFGDIIQPTHLIFILVVALLVLGPKRLPEVGRSLGRGLRDFRQGMQGVEAEARGMFRHDRRRAGAARDGSDGSAASDSVADLGDRIGRAPNVAPVARPSRPAPVATPVAKEPDPSDYSD